jgi:hypothetical protein
VVGFAKVTAPNGELSLLPKCKAGIGSRGGAICSEMPLHVVNEPSVRNEYSMCSAFIDCAKLHRIDMAVKARDHYNKSDCDMLECS